MKYRKKAIVIEAHQWFKNGDHPKDKSYEMLSGDISSGLTEGKLVRYFRLPNISGKNHCSKCGKALHNHGWIDTLEGGHIVCPGDFIITGIQGEHYPCKPDIFEQTYEALEGK
jgi:hypothetical protein